jgi:hypothetical protein
LLIDDVPVSRKMPDHTRPLFRIVQRTAFTWASSVVNWIRASSSCQREKIISVVPRRTRTCASTRPGIVLRPMRCNRRKRRIAPGSAHHLPKVILVTTQTGSSGEITMALPS